MEKIEKILIDDSNKKWRAVIKFFDNTAWLSFETKPDGISIQGEVDSTLGWDNRQIGINDLETIADDGAFIVDFKGYSPERAEQIRKPLINYFNKLYSDNKSKFCMNIDNDLKEYEKVEGEYKEVKRCQSCNADIEKDSAYGTNADGSRSLDYCKKCFKKGKFLEDLTIEQMSDRLIKLHKNSWANLDAGRNVYLTRVLPSLKRWKKG